MPIVTSSPVSRPRLAPDTEPELLIVVVVPPTMLSAVRPAVISPALVTSDTLSVMATPWPYPWPAILAPARLLTVPVRARPTPVPPLTSIVPELVNVPSVAPPSNDTPTNPVVTEPLLVNCPTEPPV